MSEVNVKLSDSGEHMGFHDLRYTNDRENGNQNATMFEIENVAGNEIFVEVCMSEQDKHGIWERKWYQATQGRGVDGVRIHITGGMENSEFLQMLRLILEAEKMVSIVKP